MTKTRAVAKPNPLPNASALLRPDAKIILCAKNALFSARGALHGAPPVDAMHPRASCEAAGAIKATATRFAVLTFVHRIFSGIWCLRFGALSSASR